MYLYMVVYICQSYIHLPYFYNSILYVCIFIPALQIG